MSRDYKTTLNLPATEFPMRGDLPKREPGILARWEAQGLYQQLRDNAAGRPLFVLHDGPRTPTAASTWATRSTRS